MAAGHVYVIDTATKTLVHSFEPTTTPVPGVNEYCDVRGHPAGRGVECMSASSSSDPDLQE